MFDRIELRPYYRKVELLTPEWSTDIDLEYMQIAAATYGGPLATKRDARKLVPVKGTCQDVIRIFDTSGTEMGHILWNHGKLISMGWSDTEELICILESAKVMVFDIFGNEKESYSICSEANVIKIAKAKIFQSAAGTGIAVMTKSGQIFLKQNSQETTRQLPPFPSPTANIAERKLLDDPNSNGNCSCWDIITEGRNSFCLLASDTDVIRLMHDQTVGTVELIEILFDKPCDRIVKISVSYNHQHLALYTNTGLLWLGSVDMRQKYCEFDTGRQDAPMQIEWIMNTHNSNADAVVISYATHLLMVNRHAEMVNVGDYSFDPIVCLVPEMDSVRIITQSSHEMIHSLPKCVNNIFYTCSFEPSCLLFMAQKKFKQKSDQAFEYLGSCHKEIELAVKECIDAATYEFCTDTQKNLMRAAYFGKVFLPSHNPRQYLRTLKILRVLNALRDKKIAIPLTYKQFFHFNPETVLSRVVFRKHYGVAIKIAKYLSLPESWIFEHWACHEAMKDPNDTEVARRIKEKSRNLLIEDISFCNIAEKAHQSGRDELAVNLLELEPRVSLHVPFMLKLGEFDRALCSATKSGDRELITSVLLEIMHKMMLSDFNMLIRDYPLALDIYKNIIVHCNRSALSDIYNSEDDHKSVAEFHLRNAIESDELESNLSVIKNSYAQGRCTVEAELCTDTERMLKIQKTISIENSDDACIRGLSIHDTIMVLLRKGNLRRAEEMKNEFEVPDGRFWRMRILTLSDQENWVELEKFSKSKRSPIGYQFFVEVCLQKNNSREALQYIKLCPDNCKVHWLMRANLHEEAINYAIKQKDLHSLYQLQRKIQLLQDSLLIEKLDSCIATLEGRR